MQIQVNTDNHIHGSSELTREIETMLETALERFGSWVTRVEIHLSDINSSSKATADDIRCVMEARPEGLRPVSASHQGATVDQAVKGCVKKLVRLLGDTKDRLSDPRTNTSYAGQQTI